MWLEETGPEVSVVDVWDGGSSSAIIFLLLAPDSVPARADRTAWDPILQHIEQKSDPPIVSILVRGCAYPKLIERTNFFRWNGDLPLLRQLDQLVIARHATSDRRTFVPARQPFFTGHESELEELFKTLVDQGGGTFHARETALAQEFARQAAGHFRETLWVSCGERSNGCIAGELAWQLGLRTSDQIGGVLREHRLLIVLDDLRGDLPFSLPGELRSSILTTTTSQPIDWTQPGPEHDALWLAFATCLPQSAPLRLAAEIIGMSEPSPDPLVECRVLDPLDEERYRMTASARTAALENPQANEFQDRHFKALDRFFARKDELRSILIAEVFQAVARFGETAKDLGFRTADFLREERRHAEAIHVLRAIRASAHDVETTERCEWELSWIEDAGERPRRPMVSSEQLQLGLAF